MIKKRTPTKTQYSKQLVTDIRYLLWVVTVGVLGLSFLCIWKGYVGSLPWLSAMVGLPWTAHGVVCTSYMGLAKSDHKQGGITYDAAASKDFNQDTPTI